MSVFEVVQKFAAKPVAVSLSVSLAALVAAAPGQAQQPIVLPPVTITTPKPQAATIERPPVARRASEAETTDPVSSAPSGPANSGGGGTPASTVEPTGTASAGGADTLASGIPRDAVGTQVSVITGDDLRRQQVRNVVDALRALPGVQVSSSGSVGGLTQIRIRGAEGRHTSVLIDGIEANTTVSGLFDFSNLLADDIERIEIVRGPMSALYGANALGGTIAISTRSARGPLTATLRTEGGSFGTKDIAARVAGGNDQGYVSVSGQWRRSEGFNIAPVGNENDGTRIANFGLSAGMRLSSTAKIDMTLRHTDKRADYDGFGAVDRSPFLTADDALNRVREQSTLAGVTLSWDALGGALTQEVKGTYARSASKGREEALLGWSAGTVNHYSDVGERLSGSYTATYRMNWPAIGLKHALTGQLETRRETFIPFSDYGFADGDGVERGRRQTGVVAEWRGTFADRLTVTAGARHDLNDTFQDITTWRASLSYAWRELGLRPHASVGKGAKQPSLYDQFGPSTDNYQANAALRMETSLGWDAGIEWSTWGGRALFDVTYFSHDLRDKINGFGGFDPATFKFFTTNAAGTSTRDGVEVSARLALSSAITLGLAYTYTDARQPDGAPEFRRAPHGGRADLRYVSADGKATASLMASYNGSQLDRVWAPFYAYSAAYTLDHYWLVGVAASYKIQPNVELFGRVENMLDSKYQEIYGYNAAGVAAYAGIKVTFGPGAAR